MALCTQPHSGEIDAAAYEGFGVAAPPPATVAAIELPPELFQATQIFARCMTQWRWISGMGGALRTGLDYGAVEAVMRMMRIAPADRPEALDAVRVMEIEALAVLNR